MADITTTPVGQTQPIHGRLTRANTTGMRQQLFTPNKLDTFLQAARKAAKRFSPSTDYITEQQQQQPQTEPQQLQQQQQQQQPQQQQQQQQQPPQLCELQQQQQPPTLDLDFVSKGLTKLHDRFSDHTKNSKAEYLKLVGAITALQERIGLLEDTNRRQNARINELNDKLNGYEKEGKMQHKQQQQQKGKGPMAAKKSSNTATELSASSSRAPSASSAGTSFGAATGSSAPTAGAPPAPGAANSGASISSAPIPGTSTSGAPSTSSAGASSATAAVTTNGVPSLNGGETGVSPPILNGEQLPNTAVTAPAGLPKLSGAVKMATFFIGNVGAGEGEGKLKEVIHYHTGILKNDIKVQELRKSLSGNRAFRVTVPESGGKILMEKRSSLTDPETPIKIEKWVSNKTRGSNPNSFRRSHHYGHRNRGPMYRNGHPRY